MVKKLFLLLLVMQLTMGVFAQMSDEQVVNLLQNAKAQGMGQEEALVMLTQKGVTKDQLLRIKSTYDQGGKSGATTATPVGDRTRASDPNAQTAVIESTQTRSHVRPVFGREIF
ncbi:MAG: capsule biosynthesis protein, partial [Odoribacter sp.]